MAIVATQNGARINFLVTLTPGTPILLIGGTEPVKCDRLMIIMAPGSSGLGKVYDDVPPPTPSNPLGTLPANIAAVCGPPKPLAPAVTALTGGGEYIDNPAQDPYNYLDLRCYALDGTQADQVIVDARLKI